MRLYTLDGMTFDLDRLAIVSVLRDASFFIWIDGTRARFAFQTVTQAEKERANLLRVWGGELKNVAS